MKRAQSSDSGEATLVACGEVIATPQALSKLTGIPIEILEKPPLLPSHQGCTRSTLCTIQAMNQLEVLMGSDWLGDHQADVDRTMHLHADSIEALVSSIKGAVNTVKRRFYMTERKAWATLREHQWDVESISSVVKLNKSYPLADHPQLRQIYMSFFGTDELCTMRRSNTAISTAVDHFIEEQCVEHVTYLMRDFLDEGEKKSSGVSGSGRLSGPTGFSLAAAKAAAPDRLPALNTAVPPEGASIPASTVELTQDWVVTLESPHGESEIVKGPQGGGKKARRRRGGRMAQHAPNYGLVYDPACKQVLVKSKPSSGQNILLFYSKDKPGVAAKPTGGGGFGGGFGGRGRPTTCAFCGQAVSDEYFWATSSSQNPHFNMCMGCCDELLGFQGVTIIYEAEKKLAATLKADELEEAQLLKARKRAATEAAGGALEEKKEPTVDYDTGVRYLKHLHSIREFHFNFLLELFRRLGLDDTALRLPLLHNPDGTVEKIPDQEFLKASPWLHTKAMNLVVFKLPWKAAEGKDYFYLRFRNVLFEQANAEVVAIDQQQITVAATPGASHGLPAPVLPVAWGATTLLILPNWVDQVDRSLFGTLFGVVPNPGNTVTPLVPQYQEDPTFPLGKHIRVMQLPNSPTVIHTVTDRADGTTLATSQQQFANLGIDDIKISYSCLNMAHVSANCPVRLDLSGLSGISSVDFARLDNVLLPHKEDVNILALGESPFACPWALQLLQYSQDWYTQSTQLQAQIASYGATFTGAPSSVDLDEALTASGVKTDFLRVFPNYAAPVWQSVSGLILKNIESISLKVTKMPKFGFLGDHQIKSINLGELMPSLMVIDSGFMMMASHLTTVVLSSSSLTAIADGVFFGCKSLVSIDCSGANGITKIGTNFAKDCHSLRRFSFPSQGGEKLKKIGAGFLCGCPALKRVDFSSVPNVSPIGFWCVSLQSKQKQYIQQQVQQGLFIDPVIDPDFGKFMQGSSALSVLDISCLTTTEFDLSYTETHLIDPVKVFRGRHGAAHGHQQKKRGQFVDWEARLRRQGTHLRFSKEQERNIMKLRERAGTEDAADWEAPSQQRKAARGFGGGASGFGAPNPFEEEEYYSGEDEEYYDSD